MLVRITDRAMDWLLRFRCKEWQYVSKGVETAVGEGGGACDSIAHQIQMFNC